MIQVYICKLPEEKNTATLEKLLSNISKEKQERIKKFAQINDVYRTVIGELLLHFILYKQLGLRLKQIDVDKNLYGKPFLCQYPSFHYNISHSGEWVVCATDNKKIGVDVEKIQPFDLQIAKGSFTKEEYCDLLNVERERNSAFYEMWTLKESYVKAQGRGLSIPLDSFNVKIHNSDYIKLTDMFTGKIITDFICKQYRINNWYKLSVCANEDNIKKFEKLPILVSFNNMCSDLKICL